MASRKREISFYYLPSSFFLKVAGGFHTFFKGGICTSLNNHLDIFGASQQERCVSPQEGAASQQDRCVSPQETCATQQERCVSPQERHVTQHKNQILKLRGGSHNLIKKLKDLGVILANLVRYKSDPILYSPTCSFHFPL